MREPSQPTPRVKVLSCQAQADSAALVIQPRSRDTGRSWLEVADLDVSYGGVSAVRGVTLTVQTGLCTSILGPNGAGKTSILRGISGLTPVGGRTVVNLDGKKISGLPPAGRARRGLGHVLENRHIFPSLSTAENLRLGFQRVIGARGEFQSLDQILDLLPELRPCLKQRAGALSGGQQQMLALGRALAGQSKILLLDEPTNGLSPALVNRISGILANLKERGLGLLLVEQRLEVIEHVTDTLHLLSHGRIVKTGDGLRDQMRDDIARIYFGT